MKTLTYAIYPDGNVYSRLDGEMAFPVLDFAEFGKDGDFSGEMTYHLEKCDVFKMNLNHSLLEYTKKIPVSIKNEHRKFWGMKPLPEPPVKAKLTRRDKYIQKLLTGE